MSKPIQKRNDILFSKTLEERFWAKVDRTDDCWLWTGRVNTGGGAQMRLDSTRSRGDQKGMRLDAHKIAYLWYVGSIPDGLEVDHLCRVSTCIRPDHLEVVTSKENRHRAEVWRKRDKLRAKILARSRALRAKTRDRKKDPEDPEDLK